MIARLGVLTLFAMLATAACARSQSTRCGDQRCPEGTQCADYRGRTLCVLPEQTTACDGRADGERCSVTFDGTCYGGTCFPIGCGNGEIDDDLYETGEQCDDSNLLGHDGCSSTCRLEAPTWEEVSNAQLLTICGQAMAPDMSRGTAMMFGGTSYGLLGTWELCDQTWRLRRPTLSPTNRTGHALADDGRRRRTVLFGGRNQTTVLGDTWEWDGTSWQRFQVATPPAARSDHAMAYDSVRGVTVLFGGRGANGVTDETWEWNGIDWTLRDDLAPRPSARADHLMAYDPVRAVIVLVGEASPGVVDTWEYDGLAFRDVTPAGARPPVTVGASIAYDAIDRRVVLYGGVTMSTSTWSWDGARWSERATSPSPAGPRRGAAATDPVTGRVIWTGGQPASEACAVDGTAAAARSWLTDVTGWTELVPATPFEVPLARTNHAAALDLDRRRIVMFGGRVGQPLEGITWELGPARWENRSSTGPAARSGHAMVYDAARRETVLFGGLDEPTTWTWNGSTWVAHSTVVRPPGCTGHAMTYDARRKIVLLFGGTKCDGITRTNETWEWNGTAWTKIEIAGAVPRPRTDHALAFDPIRGRTILFGGGYGLAASTMLGDTWSWDGVQWTELQPSSIPDRRREAGLVWDAARQRLVLIGGHLAADVWEWDGTDWIAVPTPAVTSSGVAVPGLDGAGVVIVSSGQLLTGSVLTRKLSWSAATAYEGCFAGDHDADGLVGCADPDCWASCSPHCPPGAPCDSAVRCGDTVCSALESCHSCPTDCGTCPARCGDFVCSEGEDCPGDCDW